MALHASGNRIGNRSGNSAGLSGNTRRARPALDRLEEADGGLTLIELDLEAIRVHHDLPDHQVEDLPPLSHRQALEGVVERPDRPHHHLQIEPLHLPRRQFSFGRRQRRPKLLLALLAPLQQPPRCRVRAHSGGEDAGQRLLRCPIRSRDLAAQRLDAGMERADLRGDEPVGLLFHAIRAIEERCPDLPFQYVLTTTSAPPPELQQEPWLRHTFTADDPLFGRRF